MVLRTFMRTNVVMILAFYLSLSGLPAWGQTTARLLLRSGNSSPGGSLPLWISFASSGAQIAALQFDISYDSTTFSIDATPGTQIQSASKSLFTANIAAGQKRIMIMGINQTVLSDGKMVQLFLNVTAGAQPGPYQIVLSGLSAAAPTGAAVPITGSTSTLTLTGGPGDAPPVTSSGILNAASLVSGAVSPGELITIIGDGIGPMNPTRGTILPNGLVATQIGNTSVWFDAVAAPMLFASYYQLKVIVPYEINGNPTTQLVIQQGSNQTDPLKLNVVPATPGIFTQVGNGTGQAVVLNQDGSLNSPGNPAQRGSVVMIYANGGGQLNPPAVTGQITSNTPGLLSVPASVSFGGDVADTPLYAGAAPGLVSGVIQVNVTVPMDAPTGPAVPLTMTLGNGKSTSGAMISVQ
jgi:uncharacterized protein (TIGR03437 family)